MGKILNWIMENLLIQGHSLTSQGYYPGRAKPGIDLRSLDKVAHVQ